LDGEPHNDGLVVVVQDFETPSSFVIDDGLEILGRNRFSTGVCDSEFLDWAIWIGVGEEGSHLRFINLDILLILSNVISELDSLGFFDSDYFRSANDEFDWDSNGFLKISAISIIADNNCTREISSCGCVNDDVLVFVEG